MREEDRMLCAQVYASPPDEIRVVPLVNPVGLMEGTVLCGNQPVCRVH